MLILNPIGICIVTFRGLYDAGSSAKIRCKGTTRKCYILSLSQKNALFPYFFVWLESQLDILGMETRDWREKLASNEAKDRSKNSQKLLQNPDPR